MGPMIVSELARSAGVTPDAVRYYARMGLLAATRNRANGYRQFSVSDIKRLRFIKRAQSLGFSLAEIATIIEQASHRKSPCPMVREIIQRRIEEAAQELENLILLRDRMKMAVAKWKRMPDGAPDGDAICRLIEAIDGEENVRANPGVSPARGNRRRPVSDGVFG